MAGTSEIPPPPGPFDGVWEVTMSSNIHELSPGAYDFGLATIVVSQGAFTGSDSGGISWSGRLETVAGDNNIVNATVTVDPRTGPPDAFAFHYDGQMKREPVTHHVPLTITRVDGREVMRGRLEIGPFVLDAQVRKLEVS